MRPSVHGNDGAQNYMYLRSLMFDGDLDFTNEFNHFFAERPEWFNNLPLPLDETTSRPINLYGVGNSLMWSPWVLAAHGAGTALRAAGVGLQLDGYSILYQGAVSVASCFYASCGLVLLFVLLAELYTPRAAFWGTVLVWLASPLFFYMYLHPSMSHANSFFLAALLFYIYLRGSGSLGMWAALGAVYGLLVLTRYQDGVLGVMLLVGELSRVRPRPVRWSTRVLGYVLFIVMAALVFSPQLFAWKAIHGSYFSGPKGYLSQGRVSLLAPVHAWEALFSARHGLLFWHPALALCVAGLLFGRERTRERLVAFVAFAAQLWVIGSWSIWWAGASFGHRMFISCLPFLAVGGADLFDRPAFRRWAALVTVVLVLWNFGYVVQYASAMISRQDAVPLAELVYNNFVRVPRLLFGL